MDLVIVKSGVAITGTGAGTFGSITTAGNIALDFYSARIPGSYYGSTVLRDVKLPDHVYHVEVKTINTIGGFSSLSE